MPARDGVNTAVEPVGRGGGERLARHGHLRVSVQVMVPSGERTRRPRRGQIQRGLRRIRQLRLLCCGQAIGSAEQIEQAREATSRDEVVNDQRIDRARIAVGRRHAEGASQGWEGFSAVLQAVATARQPEGDQLRACADLRRGESQLRPRATVDRQRTPGQLMLHCEVISSFVDRRCRGGSRALHESDDGGACPRRHGHQHRHRQQQHPQDGPRRRACPRGPRCGATGERAGSDETVSGRSSACHSPSRGRVARSRCRSRPYMPRAATGSDTRSCRPGLRSL